MIAAPCPPPYARLALLAALRRASSRFSSPPPARWPTPSRPESGGSPNADDIDSLYKIVLYVGILIFLIVRAR